MRISWIEAPKTMEALISRESQEERPVLTQEAQPAVRVDDQRLPAHLYVFNSKCKLYMYIPDVQREDMTMKQLWKWKSLTPVVSQLT